MENIMRIGEKKYVAGKQVSTILSRKAGEKNTHWRKVAAGKLSSKILRKKTSEKK